MLSDDGVQLVESAAFAGQLVSGGASGWVSQVLGLGPHRMSPARRPDWFFDRVPSGR